MKFYYRIINFILILKVQALVFLLEYKKHFKLNNEKSKTLRELLDDFQFRNGWYVTSTHPIWQGNDPKKKCSYSKNNIKNDNSLRIIREQSDAWKYTGVMMFSEKKYHSAIFSISVDTDFTENAKFAFWLKNTKRDVKEIDIVEIFQEKFFTFLGCKYTKATLTLHWGNCYEKDHKFYARSIWITEDSHTYSLLRENGKLRWYVDGLLAMISNDPHKDDDMNIIIEFSNEKELNEDTAIAIIDDFEIVEK
jgi:beta-glucanase (GH16 family)